MRQAFISYSLADEHRFLVSKLVSLLQEKQMQVVTSQSFHLPYIDFTTQRNIEASDLFLGIITGQSPNNHSVLSEWTYANQKRIPALLIAEDNLTVQNVDHYNIIKFNRRNIDTAIEELRQRISQAQTSTNNDELVKWVLGGAAVIALLTLLGKSK